MQHVLIVCYDFPRISGAGVIRTYQFAKRLPEFGWHPVILTAQACGEKREDNIELSDGELPCPKITAATSTFAVPVRIEHGAAGKPDGQNGLLRNEGMTGLARFAAQFAVPDGKIGWLFSAVKRGMQIVREYPIQACFSVSPRPTAHLVAYRLARRLNLPWVADFALPWSDAYWLGRRPSFVNLLDRRIERSVVRSAQRISVAYPELARSLEMRHGRYCEDKIAVAPTGFDEGVFVRQHPMAPVKFTVVYPGNHFCEDGRHGQYFLQAIDEWINCAPCLKDKVEFVFIGKRDDALLHRRMLMTHPEVIRVEPLVSHRACIRAIVSSHLCVVNTVGNRIPAKVYECMRAGKWILALTISRSDLAGVVNDYPKGMVVDAQNTAAIRQALQNIWRRCHSGSVKSTQTDEILCRYSAKNSAELLSLMFDGISQC
jgi:hypothetical protein